MADKKVTALTDLGTALASADLFHVVDTPEEVVKVIDDFYAKSLLRPNF